MTIKCSGWPSIPSRSFPGTQDLCHLRQLLEVRDNSRLLSESDSLLFVHPFCIMVLALLFTESIHAHHNGSIPIVFWKLHYEVDVDLFPWRLWYFQRLVQSCQFPCSHFEQLALLTFLTVHSYCVGHPWPIKLLPYHLLSTLLAKMSSGIMILV